ncbi:MAG TPA: error-prone DNA polymerase, partial [Myxococcaceae bacterium]|nr:error-prone DNA polymerase [Myxococcaceae bacterium]
LIGKLDFPGYFLALHDIVQFARKRGILCQGRGSAANSAVCYALGITSIDPVRMGLLFERFISLSRPEPPDIDVDFEHERREEVLQYVYEKHGRNRAAMVCAVICYRGRLAAREVGKAMGLSLDQVDRLAKHTDHYGGAAEMTDERLAEAGLSSQDATVRKVVELAGQIEGYPRHLSIHVGGFVITREPLVDIVPVENAAMNARTVVQWDKDDINALAILKVDLLALGILSAMSRCFVLLKKHYGVDLSLATIPPEDPRVYDMLSQADSIGVFQVESRAQMQMLPKLKPKTFYDLVIQVALIRPGPIIGEMVHPYLRRREGLEEVTYPSPAVRDILQKTLGVPLFQEQAMKLAMVAAGFTPVEADRLRKILSNKNAEKLLEPIQQRFLEGCVQNGYEREFAERVFNQFRGFAHYGFPESHSASFALIAYASAYLKHYYPAAFTCALLNSQPMGFYAPHTLVEDAKRHGVEVRGVDVRHSNWDSTIEDGALRLGLRLVRGLQEDSGRRLEKARAQGSFESLGDLARRSRLPRHELARLAMAGTLSGITGGRREALWQIQALGPLEEEDLFFGIAMDDTEVELPKLSKAQRVAEDYGTVGLSLESHPLALMRPSLNRRRALTAAELTKAKTGRFVGVGGLAICRQRPPTAKGVTFISLEDETGIANVVVPPELFERFRKDVLSAVFLYAEGKVERSGKVVNLKVHNLTRLALSENGAFTASPAPGSYL